MHFKKKKLLDDNEPSEELNKMINELNENNTNEINRHWLPIFLIAASSGLVAVFYLLYSLYSQLLIN